MSVPAKVTLRQAESHWFVVRAGRAFQLKHSKGVQYLAQLLSNPGRGFHALRLAGASDAPAGADLERADGAAASPAERARQSVTHALKSTLARIQERDQRLGAFLLRAIKTGTFCRYQPPPDFPLEWEVVHAGTGGQKQHGHEEYGRQERDAQPDAPPAAQRSPRGKQPPSPLETTNLVGRNSEYLQLKSALNSAAAGQGSVLLLCGEIGIGKTRLAHELGRDAANNGFVLLSGHCYESGQASCALLPFAEVVESRAFHAASPEDLRVELGGQAGALAQIAPALRQLLPELLPGLPQPAKLSGAHALRYLARNLRQYLARLCGRAPVLLTLEDLQWADETSLELLSWLACEVADLRLVILATYRDNELGANPALARMLEEFLRRRVRPLRLARLPLAAVAQMLRDLSLREPPPALTHLIFEDTGGNPLFVEEVYEEVYKDPLEQGKVFDVKGEFLPEFRADEYALPHNLRLMLDRQLDRLGEAARLILSAGAVVGQSFDARLLQSILSGVDHEALFNALEAGLRTGLLVGSGPAPDAPLSFSHGLMRRALLSGLAPARRQEFHRRIARALESLAPQAAACDSTLIAHHLLQAGSAAEQPKVVDYLKLAGRRALEATAYDAAARYFSEALKRAGADNPKIQGELLAGLARTEQALGHFERAFAHWENCLQACEAMHVNKISGNIFFEMAEGMLWAGRQREALQVANKLLASWPGALSPDRINVLMAVAMLHRSQGDFDPAMEALHEALRLARRLGDRELIARVLCHRCGINYFFLKFEQALADGPKSSELEGEPSGARLMSACWMEGALCHLARIDEAIRLGAEIEPLARKNRHYAAIALSERTRSWLEFGQTLDLGALHHQLEHELREAEHSGLALIQARARSHFALAQFMRGDWESALSYAHSAYQVAPTAPIRDFTGGVMMRVRAYSGDLQGALELTQTLRDRLPRRNRPNTISSWTLLSNTLESWMVAGEYGRAAELFPLAAQLGTTDTVWMLWASRFPQTLAGMAADAAGQFDLAEVNYQHAMQRAEHFRQGLAAIEIPRFYGAMLLRRNRRGDRTRARSLLGQAIAGYKSAGMHRHAALAAALRERLGHASSRALA